MTNKRIFIAFSMDDKWARDYLVGQAKNEKSPFEFTNMSVNEPWDENWKTNCRSRIKGCDGVIALVSKNTKSATGQLWEIKCAKDEKISMMGVYTSADDRPASLPDELSGVRVVNWTWDSIKNFIDRL